jgi:hypothetical protein
MTALAAYRDDGPLAGLLGRTVGAAVGASSFTVTVVAALPLLAALARPGAEPRGPVVAAALAWFVALASLAAARPAAGRLSWLVPPLLRTAEYAFLLRVTALHHPDALPLCFALLAALAYHHYDTVYRLRHQRVAPPPWLQVAGGGWEIRLLIAYALLVIGPFEVGLAAAAVLLGVLYTTESTIGWLRFENAEQQRLGEEDEDAL